MAYRISEKELTISARISDPLAAQKSTDYNTIKHTGSVAADGASVERKQCCYRQKGSLYEHIVYFCSLAVASYCGVFCRIYLTELVNWDGVPLFPSLYSQLVGTTIMGFITSHKARLGHYFLYQAIATGLCGSITTFSSWNSEAISSLLQTGHVPPVNGARFLSWLTTLLLGIGMITGALNLGRHLAYLSPWADSKQKSEKSEPTIPSSRFRIIEGNVFICMWAVFTVVIVVPSYVLNRRDLMFSALLAPLGTYLRWHLSPFNAALRNFKLGTFVANVAGAWVLGGVVCAQELYPGEPWLQAFFVGVKTGFCGCVTTISSFAVELSDLPLGASYFYAIISIAVAQLGLILSRGTLQWVPHCCS